MSGMPQLRLAISLSRGGPWWWRSLARFFTARTPPFGLYPLVDPIICDSFKREQLLLVPSLADGNNPNSGFLKILLESFFFFNSRKHRASPIAHNWVLCFVGARVLIRSSSETTVLHHVLRQCFSLWTFTH